jgi:hypothetical protein
MRILLHPGFHKTGTSSLQRGAAAQFDTLAPRLQLMLTPDLIEAARVARHYSERRTDEYLDHFATEFQRAVEARDSSDRRPLLISSEVLSGHLPGLKGVETYAAAPSLARSAVDVLHRHYGAEAQITVWFTTRNPETWLRSLYWQNLRAQRLTEEFEPFRDRMAPAADHARIVDDARRCLGTTARVETARIEDIGPDPLGPLGAALRHLGVATEGLSALPQHNTQPENAARDFLALNRSALGDKALSEAKRKVLRRYRRAEQSDS